MKIQQDLQKTSKFRSNKNFGKNNYNQKVNIFVRKVIKKVSKVYL